MALSKTLLNMLACPQCKGPVSVGDDQACLVCPACNLAYPIRDGIPVMLVEEATTFPDHETI